MTTATTPTKIVAAAGGLLWRQSPRGPELALVHRPRYNDWTLPKGKVQPGEGWLECALREVREETGFTAKAGSLAGCACYEAGEVLKVVRFWNMEPVGGPQPRSGAEVDALEWVTPQEALEMLSYEAERSLLSPSNRSYSVDDRQ